MAPFSSVSRALAARAESVCSYLLPRGRRVGDEWVVGSVAGEPGDSLKVHLFGEKAGVWADFASPEEHAGDLLDLWMAVKRVSLIEASRHASEFLGVAPVPPISAKALKAPPLSGLEPADAAAIEWFASRGISPETVARFRIASGSGRIAFPYFSPDQSKVLHLKYRTPPKVFSCSEGTPACLFGWQAVDPRSRTVVIVEGELDAMTVRQWGINALSVPFGGGAGKKQAWVEFEFENLRVFDDIVLWLDADEPGKQASAEIAKRLGPDRIRVVNAPGFKDANEALLGGVGGETVKVWIDSSRGASPPFLNSMSEYRARMAQEFDPNFADPGFDLPFDKARGLVKLRLGEVSVWAGMSGHGKTELVSFACLHAAARGARVCVASLEFVGAKYVKKLVRQATAKPDPSVEDIDRAFGALADKVWVYDRAGTNPIADILAAFEYSAARHECQLFVVDNLAKCGLAEDDYNGQKGLVDALTDFAKKWSVHVILVHHLKKTESEDRVGGKLDIKGSGGITDMADSVFVVWRNKAKERALRAGKPPADLRGTADAVLSCEKQRNGEEEPAFLLWFDKGSHHFLPTPDSVARPLA